MSLAILFSRASLGIQAPLVSVEAHLSFGSPRFAIVGLPEAAVRESKDRVRSALINAHFEFPTRIITVNLAPADLPKEGGRFDLPIALGILAASSQIPGSQLHQYEFIGELALSGELRPIQGVLPLALAAKQAQRTLILPQANLPEAALVKDVKLLAANHLLEICQHLCGKIQLPEPEIPPAYSYPLNHVDLCEVRGQQHAKRALTIAAAGGHSLLMFGPPGTGKTMLATRLPGILPLLSEEEALENAAVLSISGKKIVPENWRSRPFRSPHHTASSVALVGGGSPPRPGEISLAHHGVLFLDELPEFSRNVLEALREPIESGKITISRAAQQAEFPACFQLVAAMNPCPCGYAGDNTQHCRCSSEQIHRYHAKISGPLLDRIDLHLEIPRVIGDVFAAPVESAETSAQIREQVMAARSQQQQRSHKMNSLLNNQEIEQVCRLSSSDQQLLNDAIKKLNLSLRSLHKILKVARTIADLAQSSELQTAHLLEAMSYRKKVANAV